MPNIEEIETAVDSLPEEEFRRFRQWFFEKDWESWDEEIEEDSRSGALEFLKKEALDAKQSGNLHHRIPSCTKSKAF